MPPRRSRGFAITFWHYTPLILLEINAIACLWLIYQTELSPTTNQEHLQGAIWFLSPMTLAACKALFPMDSNGSHSVHLTHADGLASQSKIYCTKLESRLTENYILFEKGLMPSQGARTDLVTIYAYVKLHPTLTELEMMEMWPAKMAQYGRPILRYQYLLIKPNGVHPVVRVFHGPTGTGKSWRALQEMTAADGTCLIMPAISHGGKFWAPDYVAQPNVLFEDYRGGVDFTLFLRILDMYQLTVEIKGGHAKWNPLRIWITSNKHPRDWYLEDYEDGPLERRLSEYGSEIFEMKDRYKAPVNAPY